jgi:hypothetical protein
MMQYFGTLRSLDDEAMQFLRDVGRRVAAETGKPRSLQFLLQRVSVAVQRDNATYVIGTVREDCSWDDIFYLYRPIVTLNL